MPGYVPNLALPSLFALFNALSKAVCKTVGSPDHDMVIQLIRN